MPKSFSQIGYKTATDSVAAFGGMERKEILEVSFNQDFPKEIIEDHQHSDEYGVQEKI